MLGEGLRPGVTVIEYASRQFKRTGSMGLLVALLLMTAEAAAIGGFSPSLFHFHTTVEDDGTDSAGGWQEAAVKLRFIDGRHLIPKMWYCDYVVGMPLRTSKTGKIGAERGAEVSAEVATDSSSLVMQRRPEWLPAAFCLQFCDQMRTQFKQSDLVPGARVTACR